MLNYLDDFSGTGFGVPNWDFLGSTMVTSNYIRLTSDDRSKQGAIWNKVGGVRLQRLLTSHEK